METQKKRIMRSCEILEISAVDRPAQLGAKAMILKRDEPVVEPISFTKFADAVDYLRDHGYSGTDAMRTAARRHPALLEKHNAEGIENAAELCEEQADLHKRSSAEEAWNLLVAAIADEKKVPKTTAMQIARRRHPDKYQALQAAR